MVEQLASYRPKKALSRLWLKRSAVAIVIDQATTEQASVLLINVPTTNVTLGRVIWLFRVAAMSREIKTAWQ